MPADAATMYSRKVAKRWCDKFQFRKQKGFSFTTHGLEGANMLAREWASRADYFYRIWVEAGCEEEFRYSEEQLSSYVPSEEYVVWASTLDVGSDAFSEVTHLNHALPTNPE